KAMPVIGLLNVSSSPTDLGEIRRGPIAQGLNQAGYVEGQNVAIERRWANFHYDRLPALAVDLVSRKVDLIITLSGTPTALAAKKATSTSPIVFVDVGDPVGIGLVASLARPGGNATGFTNIVTELMPKLVELLTEMVPQAKLIALLVNPSNPNAGGVIQGSRTHKRGAACRAECRHRRRYRDSFRLPCRTDSRRGRRRPMRSSPADDHKSWRWHRGTPSRRFLRTPNTPRRAD